ncbi:MAG TPA: M4 family metallopeptidase [Nocardioides sp.]|nr:M4 family metallopeptidase [Nocardioides sp.]
MAAARSAAQLVAAKPAVIKASRHDSFKAGKVLSSMGLNYVPYERSYRGLPVVGGDFVVSTDNRGRVVATSVAQTRQVRLHSTQASFSKAAARAKSKRQLRHAALGRSRLVVLQQRSSKLAWETWVTGRKHGEASRLTVYVDARTGRVLTTKEHVLEGTGNGNWEGSVTIPTTGSGSSFSMTNSNAATLKCQNSTGNATFTGTDDVWGNGSATDRETGCVDAFYSAEKMRQMLSTWLGRNGMNGSGGWVPIRVGLNDVNAYYDGTQVQIGHTQTGGKWIGSIDVVAHEFGHGVDDKTPGGISGGGTQEFVGDTFGAATEWFANNPADVPDFTVGEEVNLVGQGPIRVMYNPSAVGDANCYSSSIPNAEVHAAAGPGNHWYYLLAMGSNPTNGQPTSPTCNGSSVTGIGVQKAQQIMYNAMLLKTTSSSYLKYRTWTLTAAKNLFPGSCTEFNTVKAAWDSVSVPAQAADPTCSATGGVTVTNPGAKSGTVGTAISSFALSASGGTAPYTWTGTGLPPGVSVSSSGTVSGTPTTAGTYNATVTATAASGGAGSATFTFTIGGTGGGGCSGQQLGNPGFETGTAAPWSASSGVVDSSASQAAHAGSWKAWLNGYGTTHTDTLSQSVTIPAGCSATLSFYLHVDSAETTTSTQYDKLTVKAGSTTLATYSNLNKASGYTLRTFNVSSLAGQTVTISFTGTEDSSLQTSFVIDDAALTLS